MTIIKSISDRTFYKCTSVSIPFSVTLIGNLALDWCSSLTQITIPSSVTRIGSYLIAYYL